MGKKSRKVRPKKAEKKEKVEKKIKIEKSEKAEKKEKTKKIVKVLKREKPEFETSFYKNNERLVGVLEKIQRDLGAVLSDEMRKAGLMSKEIVNFDTQEKFLGGKKSFLEEAQAIRMLQRMQKEVNSTLAMLDQIKNENSEETLDIYCKKLGVAPGFLEGGAKALEAPSASVPEAKPETAKVETQRPLEVNPPEKGESPDDLDSLDLESLEKLYKSGNTNALLKKLIKIQLDQQRLINQLAANSKPDNSTFNLPKIEGDGLLAIKMDLPHGQAQTESGIKTAELEISLDIPSIKIKDQFAVKTGMEQKAQVIQQQKKARFSFFGIGKEPDEKDKLRKMVLDNLKKASGLSDERKKVVAVSYILRQFLEVKLKIQKSLSYSEMVQEIQSRDIDPYIKTHLIELFTKLPESVYRGVALDITSEACLDLAQKTVQKLAWRDSINKIAVGTPAQKTVPAQQQKPK